MDNNNRTNGQIPLPPSTIKGEKKSECKDVDDDVDVFVPPFLSGGSNNGRAVGRTLNNQESSDSRRWGSLPGFSIANITFQARDQSNVQSLTNGPVTTVSAEDNIYFMENPSRGKCVIFNHCNFDKSQNLTPREGSDVDVEKIQSTFKEFGFTVVTYQDLKYEQLMFNLKEIADEDHSRNDCLVVFVLTHGQDGQVHAHDVTYKPSSLWNQFSADKCRTLAGKPKMFFIQACRGDKYDHGTDLKLVKSRTQVDGPGNRDADMYRIPNQADFLTVYATYEGHFAWRNSKHGSVFIQALCDVLKTHFSTKDVLSMLTLVNRKVATTYESRSKDITQHGKKQIPHVCHTLMRDIYLSPKSRSTYV